MTDLSTSSGEAVVATLRVEDLRVSYPSPQGDVEAVAGVSFAIAPGEVFGLVGESGSGKTSVCDAVSGLLPADATVAAHAMSLQGHELTTLGRRGWQQIRGRRIGLVPQQPMTALSPTTPVGRQLDWYLGPDAVARHATDLAELGLEAVLERPRDLPGRFSGGQLQRLVIAIVTLAHEPELLLADEPTSSLDSDSQTQVLEVLERQRARHDMAMLYVSHDLAVVERVCHRVGVMRHGHLIELAPVDQLFADPHHDYTRALLSALPTRRGGRRSTATTTPASAGTTSPETTTAEVCLAETAAPALVVDRLFHYYGRSGGPRRGPGSVVRAVDEVSLSVDVGEVLAVVGPSGSGKSTLARAVVGQINPTAGSVHLIGEELGPVRTLEQRRQLQLVTQNPRTALNRRRRLSHALDQAQRVHDVGSNRHDRAERSAQMLARVGLLPEHLDRRPTDLSGGELARAVLARSLLLSPRVLLLDEPTSSLDAHVKTAIIDLLLDLREQFGLTLVVITHDLTVAGAMADQVATMHEGQLIRAAVDDLTPLG